MCAFTQRARAAGMAQSDFGQALAGAERRMVRAAVELARTRRLLEREDMAGAFGSAFAFSAEVEKLALLARVLPAYTGHPKAAELTEQMLLDTVPIEMGYARRGWFLLKIPALLPKKGTGSPIYIQQYLYPALRRYFDGKPPACYRSCVLAYRHVYQRGRPERAYRDHDNIEVNMVTDSPDTYDSPKEITCDDFDVVTEVQFGGSEGIYLDCYAEGRIQPECEKKRWHLGTYKTLETSLSAMQTLGALGGALTYFASEYLWENGERFLSNRDLRIRALQKRQKEEEAEKS